MPTIKADHENNAELFWDSVTDEVGVDPDTLRHGVTTVSTDTWAKIQQVPGFADGPEHARTALVIIDEVETLYAVRARFDDPSGTATHEYIHGYEPTVFRSKAAAEEHAACTRKLAEQFDWGTMKAPEYYIDEITREEMDDVEEIAED